MAGHRSFPGEKFLGPDGIETTDLESLCLDPEPSDSASKAVILIFEPRDSIFESNGFRLRNVHFQAGIHSIDRGSIVIKNGIHWIPTSNPLDSGLGMNASEPETTGFRSRSQCFWPESTGFDFRIHWIQTLKRLPQGQNPVVSKIEMRAMRTELRVSLAKCRIPVDNRMTLPREYRHSSSNHPLCSIRRSFSKHREDTFTDGETQFFDKRYTGGDGVADRPLRPSF